MDSRKNEAKWVEARGLWRIKVQRDREQKCFYSSTPGARGKAEAERKADAWIDEGGIMGKRENMVFDELTQDYLAHIRTGNGTANLKRQTDTIRLYLTPLFKGRKVSSLSLLDYQDAIDACVKGREKPLSARTCGHVRATLIALYRFAEKSKVKMEQPVGLTIPPGATRGKRHIMQPDDIKLLFGPDMDRYFYAEHYRFIVCTGLRPGEFCGLRNEDIEDNILTVNRAINVNREVTSGKNENALRSIVIPELALDALKKHQKWRKQQGIISPWLFCNTKGECCREKRVYQSWLTAREKVGITATSLYELRHTMLSLCKEEVPLPLLKQVVGHSASMDTLGTYGHEVNGEKETAAGLIEAVYSSILTNNNAK